MESSQRRRGGDGGAVTYHGFAEFINISSMSIYHVLRGCVARLTPHEGLGTTILLKEGLLAPGGVCPSGLKIDTAHAVPELCPYRAIRTYPVLLMPPGVEVGSSGAYRLSCGDGMGATYFFLAGGLRGLRGYAEMHTPTAAGLTEQKKPPKKATEATLT